METFETSRLLLRPIAESDAPYIQQYINDWEVIKYLKNCTWPYPEDGALTYIRSMLVKIAEAKAYTWGICLSQTPMETIGLINYQRTPKGVSLGFWLGRKFQGNGYMWEAVCAANDYIFDVAKIPALRITNAISNVPSHHMQEKSGAKLLCVEACSGYPLGDKQHEVWELTSEAWRARKKS